MVKVKIERYSNQLEGIGYVGGKIIFIPKTKIGDVVEAEITEEKSNYYRGRITDDNSKIDCPYFYDCGGCHLRNFTYDESLNLKENSIKQLLKKNNLFDKDIIVHENINHYNYRNKISLKIVNSKVGFYQEKTNHLVEIDNCLIAKDAINDFIKDIYKIGIKNGLITIRCNYNDELLIVISTEDEIKYDFNELKEDHKIAGVILNDEKVLNDNYFIDKINETLFKVSYNSFFQVNNAPAATIVDIISKNVDKNDDVLDLYCGVGTLGLSIANKVNSLLGIEIIPNAIENALFNSRLNKIENANFILGDVSKSIDKINNDFNAVIVDPPRAGLDNKTKSFILDKFPEKLIYVSCNPITLVRDLEELKTKYSIKSFDIVDMFSFSHHIESVVILERK